MKLQNLLLIILFSYSTLLLGQSTADVIVDENGVMRWPDQTEVQGFGVNYTVPFAHAFRSAKKLGVDPKQAIDNDVYHFARLGFDAYRVHVWDTEISDTLGNLLVNEHLELFDYMLKKMKERGMKFILTPIAFWGNGWPEPAEDTPGFANKYGKGDCLTNVEAIKAQENYLNQFLQHVNPYTGLAYKDDPDVVAFEVSNEPHHDEEPDKVTTYVAKMVSAMRKTGCEKPIFYNVSHSIHLVDAYYAADIQGGTFQWYPTGLGAQEELGGNFLPNVDKYDIEFKNNDGFKKGAKIVYEFDAADIGRSYIYPAMARSFRTAGIQWATHFAYDPTYMAYANTEYNTHYMNLVYAPQKALSLKISGEVFHKVPLYKDYGNYPTNSKFDDFSVSYEEDLSELMTDTQFIYTNSTSSVPSNQSKLSEIAGFGNSAVVQYEGRGAYFLDKIEKGVWRLEVMPDAIWVQNLFGRNSLNKTVAVINWRDWPMSIDLSDLGNDFSIKAINEGNNSNAVASDKSFSISPGTYLISKKGKSIKQKAGDSWKNIKLNEFSATKTTLKGNYLLHEPVTEVSEGSVYTIKATVVTKKAPEMVEVRAVTGAKPKTYHMEKIAGYEYAVKIPAEDLLAGYFKYYIVVQDEKEPYTYPVGEKGNPMDWDFYQGEPYEVKVVAPGSAIYLFDAFSDMDDVSSVWNQDVVLLPKSAPGKAELKINLESLKVSDREGVYDYSLRYHFGKKVEGRKAEVQATKNLVLSGRSLNDKVCSLQLTLITKSGQSFGGLVQVDPQQGDYSLKLSDLKPTQLVTLPRPYPGFLPYYFDSDFVGVDLKLDDIETLQISLGPGIPVSQLDSKHGVAVESVRLE